MPLQLVCGLANSGKTGAILRAVLDAAERGESPTLVVPRLADVRRLESELSAKAALGVRVATLRTFRLELWQLAGDGRRPVGRALREAVMRSVVRQGLPDVLSDAAQAPGFTRFLVRAAQEPWAGGDLAPTAAAVRDIVLRYHEALESEGLIEESALGDLVSQLQIRMPGAVGFARFDVFTPSDAALALALSRDNEVALALTWQEGAAVSRANDEVARRLFDLASQSVMLPEPDPSSELDLLCKGLFRPPSGLQSRGEVVVGSAAGQEAEAALVARLAAGEISRGTAPDRVAIVFPSLEHSAAAVRGALAAESVPTSIVYSRKFPSTPFGRAYVSLVALASGAAGRTEVLPYIASPYSGWSVEAVQQLDKVWRRGRIADPRALMRELSTAAAPSAVAARLAQQVCRAPLGPVNWQDLADELIDTRWAGASPQNAGGELIGDIAAHRALSDAILQLGALKDADLTVSEALKVLAEVRVREGEEDLPGLVQVCEVEDVGARRFDVLILAGLTEAEWPLEVPESALGLLRAGADESTSLANADRRRLEFYGLLSRPRKRLYLVRQEADSEGRALRPSALLEDVLDAYRPAGTSDADAAAPPPVVRISRSDIEMLAPALTQGRRAARLETQGLRFAELDRSTVTSERGLEALRSLDTFSATEVEAYLECPYKWFHSRMLRPEEIDATLGAREIGSEAHRLLAEFYAKLPELGHDRVTPECESAALSFFDELAEAGRTGSMSPASLSEELAVARAASWARNVIGQDAHLLPGFVPRHVEASFGVDEPFEFAGWGFRGVIDRIDVGASGAFVTDYKSSRDIAGVEKFEDRGKVQAVIYAVAAEKVAATPACGSVYRSMRTGELRGFWRSDLVPGLPAGLCEADALGAAEFRDLVAATEQRVSDAIAGMRGGIIPRAPGARGACNYCSLTGLCEGAIA